MNPKFCELLQEVEVARNLLDLVAVVNLCAFASLAPLRQTCFIFRRVVDAPRTGA
jgi:hypothetical protein